MSMLAPTSTAMRAWQALRGDPWGLAGLSIIVFFLLIAACVWFGWLGADWAAASGGRWQGPGAEHWFGTNILGQDIFDRAVFSARIAFEIGLVVAVATTILGATLGALAGWRAFGLVDDLVLWLLGVLDSIPFYLLVAALAYAMQGQALAMYIAMIFTFWTATARLVRAEVMRIRNQDYVKSARAIGLPGWRIVVRHVLPNTSHILLVQGTLVFVAAIKAEVILSFLGLGVQNGVSWGVMLAESTQEVIAGHFGNFLAASCLLFLFLLGLNLFSDALQDALKPGSARLRSRLFKAPA